MTEETSGVGRSGDGRKEPEGRRAAAGRATTTCVHRVEEAITGSLWSRSTRQFFHLGEVKDFHTSRTSRGVCLKWAPLNPAEITGRARIPVPLQPTVTRGDGCTHPDSSCSRYPGGELCLGIAASSGEPCLPVPRGSTRTLCPKLPGPSTAKRGAESLNPAR